MYLLSTSLTLFLSEVLVGPASETKKLSCCLLERPKEERGGRSISAEVEDEQLVGVGRSFRNQNEALFPKDR